MSQSFTIMTLEQALEDQRDLEHLCEQRPHPGYEIYWPNENYGHARVLKVYAGYPEQAPIWAVVPHGVDMMGQVVYEGEAGAPVPAVLTYPEHRDRAFREHSRKNVIPSASPFLYALAMMDGMPDVRRAGTLVMPIHSTAGIGVDTDWAALADEALALDERFHPVTMCCHWHDYKIGAHKPFAERGIPVVSAGNIADQDFLFRLIHLMSRVKYVASNGVSSATFYALFTGRPFFIIGAPVGFDFAPGSADLNALWTDETKSFSEELRQAFLERPEDPTPEQQGMAHYFLGAERFKSPTALLMDLQWCEHLARRSGF